MQPFLKWAGGKRWLFTKEFVAALPPHTRYVEPFLGGAAGFFALKPEQALLSDVNGELINLYKVVRDSASELRATLSAHQRLHSEDHYYDVRSNSPSDPIEQAARTLYLNRTCWNGLYRLNKMGKFNVPIGTKTKIVLDTDDFDEASARLASAELSVCDFEETLNRTSEGDLVFIDPPYTVMHNMNGFVKYNENIFKWEDQIRLKDASRRAVDRGATVIITNADHPSLVTLYDGFGVHEQLKRRSVISGKVSGRAGVSELMVRA